ncbi:hypothetical protein OHA40_07195 [Nocardia sp. NBC_00508]|uniref:hypothetical protein n=1 Tax=Nocardia sp. NBC_00508 TaxID=2975992 RepID=UPI002E814E53|nr:hypothetical protein [Nocardia sp. NBC_00508]WUD67903.1 hypothetical protein OHA40_07195 [Nocardia sp. NBC_00508]
MTDRSPEDEMIAEARKFARSLPELTRLHAQARNFLERRKIRKEISRTLREQRREAEVMRKHQLTWTSQAIDRYRVHVQAVAERANDPSVDHDRRARDAHALAEHRNRLARGFIGNEHLTRTEQGIALDGLDSATIFPHFKVGNLFAKAHKVRGIDALRYRAHVARETVNARQHTEVEREDRQQSLDAARRANAEESLLARIDAAQDHRHRYTAEMTWTDPDGGKLTESRSFATEHSATSWLQRNISGTSWSEGTTLAVETRDTLNAAKQYVDYGRPETVADQLADRESVLRERTLSGQVHHEQADRQRENTDRERPPDTAGVDRLAQVERQLNDMAADRDRLDNRVGLLQRGLDSVTADRDEIRRKLDTAEGHIEALKNRNLRLSAEVDALRARPGVEQLTAERDQLKQERDEAVRKLVQSTPEHERYGNRPRRSGANGNGAEQEQPNPTLEQLRDSVQPGNDTGPVGKRASYLRDLGSGREQAGPDTQSWPRPERNGNGRNGIERSR